MNRKLRKKLQKIMKRKKYFEGVYNKKSTDLKKDGRSEKSFEGFYCLSIVDVI